MVDVSAKSETERLAVAEATVVFNDGLLDDILARGLDKGDLFATARIAGIQAAKRCSDLIPLCHPLPLSKVSIDLTPTVDGSLKVTAMCKTTGKTGGEMEALTAASVAALTVYDMCKARDKGIRIEGVQLSRKTGGKSGDWERTDD